MSTLKARARAMAGAGVDQMTVSNVLEDEQYDQRVRRLLAEQRAAWARGDRRAALAARAVVLKMVRGKS